MIYAYLVPLPGLVSIWIDRFRLEDLKTNHESYIGPKFFLFISDPRNTGYCDFPLTWRLCRNHAPDWKSILVACPEHRAWQSDGPTGWPGTASPSLAGSSTRDIIRYHFFKVCLVSIFNCLIKRWASHSTDCKTTIGKASSTSVADSPFASIILLNSLCKKLNAINISQ